jgi:hypothetical protein
MPRSTIVFVFLLMAAITAASPVIYPQTGRVVDRIVARIEDDIILQSQVREAGAFQKLIEGHAETDDRLLAELIEQWVVENEATASHFPQPAQQEVDRELSRLTAQFGGPEAFAAKLREQELSAAQVRQILVRQIYVERYLDSKFRPSVQIESISIATYYRNELVPELQKKNQPVPRLNEVDEQIRELLTQRAITDLAAKWLDETKSHLKIELKSSDAKLGA